MDIPRYPASKNIEMADKSMLDLLFERMQPRVSELTFASLYLFRRAHDYRLTRCGDSLVALGRGYDGQEYFLPPLERNTPAVLETLFAKGLVLYGCDERFVESCLKDLEDIELVEDRNSFDYLYLRKYLAELPGNRYHRKKNRVNYFTARHSYRVESYSGKYLEGALQLLEDWRRVRSEIDSSSLDPEVEASAEGLEKAERLGLEGVVVLVDDRVRAFALGERLNSDTSVCHFEKADPFLEGLYQLVDREFNSRCFTDCILVNREQDLGEPNLRQSKLSYQPVELVKKFRAWKRKPAICR
ncbi:MAG: DUF2156 domain-containing protein [Deltaproteobacteria bacterium]|nr:DUF2156 domain-containing protein [Deltaproteobacteria bacterium]